VNETVENRIKSQPYSSLVAHKGLNKKPFNKSHGQSGDTNKRCWHCNSMTYLSFQCTVRPRDGVTGAKSLLYSAGTSRSVLPGPVGHQSNRVVQAAGESRVF